MRRTPLEYASSTTRGRSTVRRVLKLAWRHLPALLIAPSCYVGSYVCLSASGRYEPGVIGSNGVKWYAWAPAGFVKDYRQRGWLVELYLPLYRADLTYWHRNSDAYSGRYPINVPKDVREVSAARKKS